MNMKNAEGQSYIIMFNLYFNVTLQIIALRIRKTVKWQHNTDF